MNQLMDQLTGQVLEMLMHLKMQHHIVLKVLSLDSFAILLCVHFCATFRFDLEDDPLHFFETFNCSPLKVKVSPAHYRICGLFCEMLKLNQPRTNELKTLSKYPNGISDVLLLN